MIILSAESIDELNMIYRQLKHTYLAMDKIKQNPETNVFQLKVEKKILNPMVKNLADKVLDWCETELFEIGSINEESLSIFLLGFESQYQFVEQLNQMFESMTLSDKRFLASYFEESLNQTLSS
ncbi:MAG: hypothetical protein ACI8QD_000210 [Cyclobacteriaceae bacterium]|jgi:hypothetical protein